MIYQLSQFLFPDDPARLFPETPGRELYLEIGFGDGRFWPHHARTFAEPPNYLGAEISGSSLQKAQARLLKSGLTNAHLTKLPAMVLLGAVVPAGSLSGIIVNFPDPWPKKDHLDQRLLRAPFFRLAASRLKPGGAVLLTTDHEEYFDFACQEAEESGVTRLERAEPPAAALETKYALKWRELGIAAQHARFVSTADPFALAARLPRPDIQALPQEDADLPHSIVKLPAGFDLSDFAKQAVRGDTYTVVLLDAYRSLRRPEYTVLAHVEEGELTQEVLVGVMQRPDGSTLVRLAKFGGPIITAGVKAAVGAVTDELVRRGAVVTHLGY
ncbi:tRNA (guanine(46)-N(7))-methyltransferase TrmB [Deinococcus altitudinis]|uniref:tRNA (guanine(46)-N(7))-methyltransferase TrmB n=1 Tax=Deinococcus altitudinis TaxID=468914 RepID=UPI0038917C07